MTTLTAVLKSSRKLIETEARSIPPRNIHVTTPRNIHVTTPRNIHVTTPRNIHVTTPRNIHVTTPRNIHVTTPRNIHVTTPRNIHVTTPIMAWHKHFNTKCRVQHFSGPKYKCYLKFYSKYL
jgi:hypothetical protein